MKVVFDPRQLGHAPGRFLAAQSLLLACAQLILRGARWRGLRSAGLELGQFQIHAELLKAAIPRRQFVLEALLCGFRGGLQCCNLRAQRVDGLCGGGVFLDNWFRGVAQLLDLSLQGGDLRQKLRVGLDGVWSDEHNLGLGRGQGLDGAKAIPFVLEDVRSGRRQGFLSFGL